MTDTYALADGAVQPPLASWAVTRRQDPPRPKSRRQPVVPRIYWDPAAA